MSAQMKYATPKVFYICDRKACGETCPNEACNHTCDIEHAVNFSLVPNGAYFENENDLIARFIDEFKDYRPSLSMTNNKSIKEIIDTMNDEQLTCMYWLIGSALCDNVSK